MFGTLELDWLLQLLCCHSAFIAWYLLLQFGHFLALLICTLTVIKLFRDISEQSAELHSVDEASGYANGIGLASSSSGMRDLSVSMSAYQETLKQVGSNLQFCWVPLAVCLFGCNISLQVPHSILISLSLRQIERASAHEYDVVIRIRIGHFCCNIAIGRARQLMRLPKQPQHVFSKIVCKWIQTNLLGDAWSGCASSFERRANRCCCSCRRQYNKKW